MRAHLVQVGGGVVHGLGPLEGLGVALAEFGRRRSKALLQLRYLLFLRFQLLIKHLGLFRQSFLAVGVVLKL